MLDVWRFHSHQAQHEKSLAAVMDLVTSTCHTAQPIVVCAPQGSEQV